MQLGAIAYNAYRDTLSAWWTQTMQDNISLFKITPWDQLRADQQAAWQAAAAAVKQDLEDAE